MKKKVYLVDIKRFKRSGLLLETIEGQIKQSGDNTGNIIWYESVKRRIAYDMEIGIDDKLNDKGIYVIPMSNNIAINGWQIISIAKKWAIEGNRIIILGLGARITHDFNSPEKLVQNLSADFVDAMKAIAEHGIFMIRGNITAECMELMGIMKYKILGCPSFYYDPLALAYSCKSVGKLNENNRVVIHFDGYGGKDTSKYLLLCISSQYWKNMKWLVQGMADISIIRALEEGAIENVTRKFPNEMIEIEKIEAHTQEKQIFFSDFDKWMKTYKASVDYSCGMRFHGNMMAAISGVPTIWITHDSRTRELVDVLDLPSMDITGIDQLKNFEEIKDKVRTWDDSAVNHYHKKYDAYTSFLGENDLQFIETNHVKKVNDAQ